MTRLAMLAVLLGLAGCKKDEPKPVEAASGSGSAALAAGPADGVTFTMKGPAVGSRYEDVSKMKMAFDMSVEAMGVKQKSSMSTQETVRFTVEFLAVEGDTPTKARVVYLEKSSVDSEDGKEKKAPPAPVVGKTYLVSMHGEDLDITTDDGTPVSQAETAIVTEDCDFIGRPDDFRTALPKRPLKIGEDVPELRKAIQKIASAGAASGSGGATKVSGVSVRLKSDEGDHGLFDVAMTMSMNDGPVAMVIELKGAIDVRKADSQLTRLVLEGPVTVKPSDSPEAAGMKMAGAGTMSIALTQKPL